MKPFYYFLLLIAVSLNAQEISLLSDTQKRLDEALIKKDTAALDLILHDQLSLIHSNGFEENKAEMKENTAKEFIKYNQITQSGDAILVEICEGSYLSYRLISVEGIYDVYDFQVNLRVKEEWIWEENRWQLIGRQSLEVESP